MHTLLNDAMKLQFNNPLPSVHIDLSIEEIAMLRLFTSTMITDDDFLLSVIPDSCTEDDADSIIDFACEMDRSLSCLLSEICLALQS